MADNFRAHSDRLGSKLGEMQASGLSRLARMAMAEDEKLEPVKSMEKSVAAKVEEKADTGKRRGRPSLGKPWEAEGISRSAYFAKRKGEK